MKKTIIFTTIILSLTSIINAFPLRTLSPIDLNNALASNNNDAFFDDNKIDGATVTFFHNAGPYSRTTNLSDMLSYLHQQSQPQDIVFIDLREQSIFRGPRGHICDAINLPNKDSIADITATSNRILAHKEPLLQQSKRVKNARYVVFHCQYSTSRTPTIAAAYGKYLAQTDRVFVRQDQVSVMLKGGFNAIDGNPNAEKMIRIEGPRMNIRPGIFPIVDDEDPQDDTQPMDQPSGDVDEA